MEPHLEVHTCLPSFDSSKHDAGSNRLLSVFFLDEVITVNMILGILLVLSGVILVQMKAKSKK